MSSITCTIANLIVNLLIYGINFLCIKICIIMLGKSETIWYNEIMNGSIPTIVSITELRRNFGKITKNLAKTDAVILTKGGTPFAILKATTEEKKKLLKKTAGAWKKTPLDDDSLWKEVAKKKSRTGSISL